MSTGGSRSVRRNTMPVLGGAGRSIMRTLRPVCRPMPVDRIDSFSVRCWAMAVPCGLNHIVARGHRPPASGGRPTADVPFVMARLPTGHVPAERSARRPDARRRARKRSRTSRSPSRSSPSRDTPRLSPPGAAGMPGCPARPRRRGSRAGRLPPRAAAGAGAPAGRGGCSPAPGDASGAAPPA